MKKKRRQRTLARCASYQGIGIHTGSEVSLRFVPAPEATGLIFKRTDLPSQPCIPASLDYVCDTVRSTTLGKDALRIHTVEHVLAALKAYNIDNAYIELSNIEPPIGNGSSDVFVDLIEEAGIEEQQVPIDIATLNSPVYWSSGDIHLVALPSDEYRLSYTLSYPQSPPLSAQYHSIALSPDVFKSEIAPCRTFSLYDEIAGMMDRGLVRGGSLDNAVVIHGDAVFSKNGLFFPNEMVRHKILDLIGDLALIGRDFLAHIISIRAGHAANFAFAKALLHTLTTET